ncbi:hypothetical protein BDV19DRAFT_71086 [Aspergillus venezuelensis]
MSTHRLPRRKDFFLPAVLLFPVGVPQRTPVTAHKSEVRINDGRRPFVGNRWSYWRRSGRLSPHCQTGFSFVRCSGPQLASAKIYSHRLLF